MSGKVKRSKQGCQTCKRRRKKCDEARPACNECRRLGLECQGYERPLIWANGIASRGKLKGANFPNLDRAPREKRPAGGGGTVTLRDVAGSSPASSISMSSPGALDDDWGAVASDHDQLVMMGENLAMESLDTELSERLIVAFFASGHQTLYAGANKDDSPVIKNILPMARTSSTLRLICVAYQALISHIPASQFEGMYDRALQQYRADLADCLIRNEDDMIAAGILLCSIGASQGFPWTFHIKPLFEILTMRADFASSPFHSHALDVMGWYDLPSFVLNRKHVRLDIWRTYCVRHSEQEIDEIEPVSGLPRSLLDIFSCLEEPDCEERLWLWQGREGDVLQIYLWDAFRFAGMLKCRELKRDYADQVQEGEMATIEPKRRLQLPGDSVLLNRLIASLNVIYKLQVGSSREPLVINAIIYPLFLAGCHIQLLQQKPEWQEVIDEIFDNMIACGKRQMEPMREILQIMRSDRSATADEVAAKMQMEIALF